MKEQHAYYSNSLESPLKKFLFFYCYCKQASAHYKELALSYMQNDALFDPLAKGIRPLKGKYAYSHVNALN